MNAFPDLNKANDYGGGSGDFYKFEKGDNRIRILAMSEEPIAKHFIANKPVTCIGLKLGCPYHDENAPKDDHGKPKRPSVKYPAYIIDRKDEEAIRLIDTPFTVVKQLADLRSNPDWAFETLPMEYDVTIKFDPDATGTDMYKVVPSPKRTPIPEQITERLGTMKNLDEMVEEIRVKAAQAAGIGF